MANPSIFENSRIEGIGKLTNTVRLFIDKVKALGCRFAIDIRHRLLELRSTFTRLER